MAANRYRIKEIERLSNQQPSADLFWEVYGHITSALQRTSREGVGTSGTPGFGFGVKRDVKMSDGRIRKEWHFTVRAYKDSEAVRISCFPIAIRHCPERFEELATLFLEDEFEGPFNKDWGPKGVGLTIASMSRWREHGQVFLDALEIVGHCVRAELGEDN